MAWYEDLVTGEATTLGTHVFTPAEAEAFARRFDPLALAADPAAGPAVSGWHVACVWMRRWADHMAERAAASPDPGIRAGTAGPAPGLQDLEWPHPAPCGIPIALASRLLDKRASASRPGWGLAIRENTASLPDGRLAMRFRATSFIRRRPPG